MPIIAVSAPEIGRGFRKTSLSSHQLGRTPLILKAYSRVCRRFGRNEWRSPRRRRRWDPRKAAPGRTSGFPTARRRTTTRHSCSSTCPASIRLLQDCGVVRVAIKIVNWLQPYYIMTFFLMTIWFRVVTRSTDNVRVEC